MGGPAKRVPGQSNAEHGRRGDPNADFLGTSSLDTGGDGSWSVRLFRALFAWRDKRRGKA